MDPITILVTAASATRAVYQVSTTLYCFIQGSFTADKSLQSFVSELDSLKNSIVAIEACLRSPSFQVPQAASEDATPEELFSSLDTSLKNCQATLEQFEAVLIKLTGNSSERNPFRKPIMKIKLDLNAKDVVLYRAQIGTHSSAMQMALQTINIYTSIRAPDVVISQLEPKLDFLIELMAALKMPPSNQIDALAPTRAGSDERSPDIAEGVTRLKRVAEKVVSSASTVIGSGSTTWGGSVFSYQPELGDHQLEGISRWNLETINEVGKRTDFSDVEGLIDGYDSDDEIDREVMNQMISEGRTCHLAGNSDGATKFYRSALRVAEKIRLLSRSSVDYNFILLDLAYVTMVHARSEAIEVLIHLVDRFDGASIYDFPPAISNQFISAIFLLSGLQFMSKHFEDAERGCRRVMQIVRRLEGQDSIRYDDSLRFMVQICDAKKDMELATAYRKMIPGVNSPFTVDEIYDIYVPSWVCTYPVDGEEDNGSAGSRVAMRDAERTSSLGAPRRTPTEKDEHKTSPFYTSLASEENIQKISNATSSRDTVTEPRNPSPQESLQTLPTEVQLATRASIFKTSYKPMRSQQEVRANRCNNPFDFPILKNYFGDQERKYSTMNQLWSNEWDSSFKSLHFDPHMAMINAIRVSDTWMIYVFLFHFDEIKKRWKKGMSRSDKFKTQYRNFPDEIDLSYRKGIGQTILEIAWVEVQRQPEHYIIIVLLFAYGADIDYIMPGVWDDFSGNVRTKQKYCETLVHKLTTIRNKAREKEGKSLPYNTQWRD